MQKNIIEWSRVDIGSQGYVASIDTSQITPEQIQKIYEIEQDMWSHGLGSYIWCNNCETISSKEDLYGYLEKTLRMKTVHEIEAVLWNECPDCPSCKSNDTYHVFDEEYRDTSIATRYSFEESFLTVFCDISWEIRGFMNAYVTDFDTIYDKEFEPFYGESTRPIVAKKIQDIIRQDIPEKMIWVNNIWTEQPYASMTIYYYILKSLCHHLSMEHSDMLWLWDSILWNATNGLYHICWWERLEVDSYLDDSVINEDFKTDIMLHKNTFADTLDQLWDSPRDFFRKHIWTIKNIVKA